MSQTIRKMIVLGESENPEFKASFDKEAIESLAAFANHEGGVVLIPHRNRQSPSAIPATFLGFLHGREFNAQ